MTFPPTPAELPEWLQMEAYDKADPPVAFTLPVIRTQVPMRRTNKAVVQETQVSPSGCSGQGAQQQLMMWMQELFTAHQQQRQPTLQVLKPPARKRQLALPAPEQGPCQRAKTDEPVESQETQEQPGQQAALQASPPTKAVPEAAPAALPHTGPASENGAKPVAALEMPKIVMAAIENRKEEREEKARGQQTQPKDPAPKAKAKAKARPRPSLNRKARPRQPQRPLRRSRRDPPST